MLIDDYEPAANFASSRRLEVDAPGQRVWSVLPELPILLRRSRLAIPAAVPLLLASLMRREGGRGEKTLSPERWLLQEGEMLFGRASAGSSNWLRVERVEEGREVILLGHHRYADYVTNFYVEPLGPERARLHNVTRALFRTRGLARVYLAGVHIFHSAYVDWMLRRLRSRAERP